MEYEIVNLEEKKAVGISAVTNNKSPEMPKIIGGLCISQTVTIPFQYVRR